MKYKLINKTTGGETLCDKVTIDGFDYYVSDKEIKPQDKFYSYLIFEDEEGEEIESFGIYTCLLNYKSKYDNHITSIETGRNSDNTKHFIFETDTCKLVIATNNPNIDIPKVVDEVERLANIEYPFAFGGIGNIENTSKNHFIKGYNKSQETHPFSEEDMIEFYEWCDSSEEAAIFWRRNRVNLDMNGSHNKIIREKRKELLQLWKEQRIKTIYYE